MNRAWVEVSLDAISHNIGLIKAALNPGVLVMAAVKADAYGHGAPDVARVMLHSGVDVLGVACPDEAYQLRKSGITAPIISLGYFPIESAVDIVSHDITPAVFDFSMAKAISNASLRLGKTSKIHVKVDTGMGRVGFQCNNAVDAILDIAKMPNIEIEGIFSHLACADDENDTFSSLQFERFTEILVQLKKNGLIPPLNHMANSAATLKYPHMQLDMVRAGIATFGFNPGFKPAMQLKTVISHIKDVPAGTPISYGGDYITPHPAVIATIPIGYADGYSRRLSGKAVVLVGGKKVPVVGKICMDQCMIDVTNVNNLSIGDEVVLFGTDGENHIPVEEVAAWADTINYEILSIIGRRVPRVYTRRGAVTGIKNYLNT